MTFLVWSSTAVNNACRVEPLENVERFRDLKKGVSFGTSFPADALVRMSKSFKKDTKLVDDVKNGDEIKICSKRLAEFLRSKRVKNVEFLALTILDHKGKVAASDYCIVHPIVLQDALDVVASKPRHNAIRPKDIDGVEELVVDERRVDPKVSVFRLAGLNRPVLIRQELADDLTAAGFVGPYFMALQRYGK